MAKKEFKVGTPSEVMTAEQIITKLETLDNVSDPFSKGRCPYKDAEPCGVFNGFVSVPYTNGDKSGYWVAIDLEGQKPVAISCFLAETEEALDDDGNETHKENEGGLADVIKSFDSIRDPRLYPAIADFFARGSHKFQITEYKRYFFGKKQRNHLINII